MLGNFVAVILYAFLSSVDLETIFPESNRVSNSLDPGQAGHLSGLILVQTACKNNF